MQQPSFDDLMQQAKKMQEKMLQAQDELTRMNIVGEAGGGMVKITFNGKHEAKSIYIDASLHDDEEMLGDLIIAAINQAAQQIENVSRQKLGQMTKDLGIPENFDGFAGQGGVGAAE